MSKFDPVNWYLTLPKKYQTPALHLPCSKEAHIQPAKRWEICGKPGSQKSSFVKHLICNVIGLKNITGGLFVFARELASDTLYQHLAEEAKAAGITQGCFDSTLDRLCDCSDEECDKMHVDALDVTKHHCMIFDDQIGHGKRTLEKLNHWTLASRRSGVTLIWVTQQDCALPMLVRRCIDYRVCKAPGCDLDDLRRMLQMVTSKANTPLVLDLYRQIAAKQDPTQFLLIDTSGAPDPDKCWGFRWNFRPTRLAGLV